METDGRALVVGTCGNPVALHGGVWHTHHSFGGILQRLAPRVGKLIYHAPLLAEGSKVKADCALQASNIEVRRWGEWHNTMHALHRPDRLIRQYWQLARSCDVILIRGTHPLNWLLHWMAATRGQRVVHWIAANAVQILRNDPRGYGRWIERLGLAYAYSERYMLCLASRVSRGYLVTSGLELARVFRSPRTIGCESSSTTSEADFRVRTDTCEGPAVRVLFLGFIRPEKGIEYLLRAIPLVRTGRRVEVALVGGWDQFPAERERLVRIIGELGLEDRVTWVGYVRVGPELFAQIDRSDLLVLPSLSEGTPHVLIEARSRSLPVVASSVGGIPDSVTDGEDGLLVPPREPRAIAEAISRIVEDGALRRRLIAKGRERVRKLTIEWFVDLLFDLLTDTHGTILAKYGTMVTS